MAAAELFQRFKEYYTRASEKDTPPAINAASAAALSITFTLLYIVPFYISTSTRPSPRLSRDAPSVIRARIRLVTISVTISVLISSYVLASYGHASPTELFRLLGYWPISFSGIARSLLLTALLFAGPVFEKGVVEGGWRQWIRGAALTEVWQSWIGWRNYVAGPISEELVFRSAIIPLHLLCHTSPSHIIFLTPLYFGIAHVNHFYEYTLTNPHTPLLPALIRSLVQFAYTSVFGFYATFLFLRTGSLPAVVLVHSFCNWCGLPRVWGRVESLDEPLIGPPIPSASGPARPKVDDDRQHKADHAARYAQVQAVDGRLGVGWTVAYYVILVGGAVAFWKFFWVLTESERSLLKIR